MVDFILTEEQAALKELCRNFGEQQLQPIADELDNKASEDPEGPFPWGVLKEFSSLGLKNLPLPEKWGGADMGVLTHCVLLEELMAAEAGFAAAVHQSWKLAGLIAECGTEEQVSKYIPIFSQDDTFLMGDGTLGPISSPEDLRLAATREGSGWVIDGNKRFVACGPLAKLFIVDAKVTGAAGGMGETITCIVPKETSGVRPGEVHDKMGTRLFLESELDFEKCRIPGEEVLSDGGGNGSGAKSRYFAKIAPTLGAFGVGIARAALEKSIEHTLERVQGGKPIFEHDVVSFRLAEMKVDVDVARDLVWRAACHSDDQRDYDPRLGLTSVLFASQMAPRVCDMAIQLFGGYGFMRDYPVQKYWRDALMCLFHGETHDTARLKLGRLMETEHI
ncbi:MAG: acyl-CoA dehydrogenase family protein [Nitrospinota bacterium]|nr:acyl-CoA dehydrogenase family protein [Nitrospinota bacterium]